MSKAKATTTKPVQVSKTSTVKRKETAKKVTFKDRLDNIGKGVRGSYNNTMKRLGFKSKKAKKVTKTQKQLDREQKKRGIIGIGLLFVVVSIAYSTYMTNLFVDGPEMIVALAPQVAFAAYILIKAFYKLYK